MIQNSTNGGNTNVGEEFIWDDQGRTFTNCDANSTVNNENERGFVFGSSVSCANCFVTGTATGNGCDFVEFDNGTNMTKFYYANASNLALNGTYQNCCLLLLLVENSKIGYCRFLDNKCTIETCNASATKESLVTYDGKNFYFLARVDGGIYAIFHNDKKRDGNIIKENGMCIIVFKLLNLIFDFKKELNTKIKVTYGHRYTFYFKIKITKEPFFSNNFI